MVIDADVVFEGKKGLNRLIPGLVQIERWLPAVESTGLLVNTFLQRLIDDVKVLAMFSFLLE